VSDSVHGVRLTSDGFIVLMSVQGVEMMGLHTSLLGEISTRTPKSTYTWHLYHIYDGH